MGFFKDLKRDFAQAVNELMPESDSSKNKNKDHAEPQGKIENLDPQPSEGNTDTLTSGAPGVAAPGDATEAGKAQTPAGQINEGADAISEAVLRKEAERLRQEIGKNIDIEAKRASEEIDSEIDNLPDVEEGWEDSYTDEDYGDVMQPVGEITQITEVEDDGPIGTSFEEAAEAQAEYGSAVEAQAEYGSAVEAQAEYGEAAKTQAEYGNNVEAQAEYNSTVEDYASSNGASMEEMTPAMEEIPLAAESDSSEVDMLEAKRVASEVARAEEDRLIEEERLAAAERHAEEEAELRRLVAEEEKRLMDMEREKAKELAAKDEAAAAETKKKGGKKQGSGNSKNKKNTTIEKTREEDKMPDLETEISKNDVYSGMSEDTTYITSKTVISGNIETEDDIDVMGRVDGDVSCKGKLIIGGRVNGNIRVQELYAHQAHIAGEIFAEGSVKIGAGTISVGNITASSAVIAGAVKGDVDVKEQVIVDSSAVVVGNIRSKSIQVNAGAIVDGMCQQIYSDVNIEKLFDEEIEDLDESRKDEEVEKAAEEPVETAEIKPEVEVKPEAELRAEIAEDETDIMEIEGLEPLAAEKDPVIEELGDVQEVKPESDGGSDDSKGNGTGRNGSGKGSGNGSGSGSGSGSYNKSYNKKSGKKHR